MNRRELFAFQKERIEHVYSMSPEFRPHRAVMVVDLSDEMSWKISGLFREITAFRGPDDLRPTAIYAIENEASLREILGRFFPNTAAILDMELDATEHFVILLADGGCSVVVHEE